MLMITTTKIRSFQVTRNTESASIFYIKTKFWEFRKLFDVISIQFSTTLATENTSKSITSENFQTPQFHFYRGSNNFINWCNTTFPVASFITRGIFTFTRFATKLCSRYSIRMNLKNSITLLARNKNFFSQMFSGLYLVYFLSNSLTCTRTKMPRNFFSRFINPCRFFASRARNVSSCFHLISIA